MTIKRSIEQGFAKGENGLYDILQNFNNMACGATITVAEKDTDEWYVYIQLTDYLGNDITVPNTVIGYLASDADGLDINEASVTTETAIKADGSISVLTTKIAYLLTSEADGDIDLTITDTGADVYYFVVVLPTGKLVISDAITFEG